MMALQETFPVIFLSFASLKAGNFAEFKNLLLKKSEDVYSWYPEVEMDPFIVSVNRKIGEGETIDIGTDAHHVQFCI